MFLICTYCKFTIHCSVEWFFRVEFTRKYDQWGTQVLPLMESKISTIRSWLNQTWVNKVSFSREHFSKGPVLNGSMVVKTLHFPRVKGQQFLLSKFYCKILSNFNTFHNHAKKNKGPQLNLCCVNSTWNNKCSNLIYNGRYHLSSTTQLLNVWM